MENERRKKLIESMKKLNKNFKDSFTDFAKNLEEESVISSGIEQFDNFIGKGFKRGNFVILWGGESVGKSTLALQTVANCQKEGKIACYIDMERSFDAVRAKDFGINLGELVLVSKCQTAEDALEIIRAFSKDKVVDLIVLDSIQAMSPKGEQENKGKERELASREMAELARTLSKFFRVVAPDVFRAKIACILIGQVRMNLGSFFVKAELSGGLGLKHWAYQSIFMRRGQKSDAPVEKFKEYFIDPEGKIRYSTKKEPVGFNSVIKLEKTKSSQSKKEGSEINMPFVYKKGFVDSIESTDDIPITIDSDATEEQRKQIKEYLKEKGLTDNKGNTGKIIPPQGGTGETKPTEPEKPDENIIAPEYDKVFEGTGMRENGTEKKSKKKRGRPKKVKE